LEFPVSIRIAASTQRGWRFTMWLGSQARKGVHVVSGKIGVVIGVMLALVVGAAWLVVMEWVFFVWLQKRICSEHWLPKEYLSFPASCRMSETRWRRLGSIGRTFSPRPGQGWWWRMHSITTGICVARTPMGYVFTDRSPFGYLISGPFEMPTEAVTFSEDGSLCHIADKNGDRYITLDGGNVRAALLGLPVVSE
jgi:hypothetical protein